jgi:ABC-type glycerol-3-phosphate transport system substrate-binding protein
MKDYLDKANSTPTRRTFLKSAAAGAAAVAGASALATPARVGATRLRDTNVTITVVGAASEFLPAVKIYNTLYPNVKVNIITANWGNGGADTREKELVLMSSGQSLDVLTMVWGKSFFRQGVLQDLTAEVRSWPIYKDYTAGQKQRMTYNGRIFGPTWGNNTDCLWYNKDILAKIHAKPPKTLNDVVAIAKAIKAANLMTAKGQPVFATSFEGGNWATDYWVWANGGDLMTPDFKHTLIDSPKDIAAYAWMQNFIKNGWAPKVDGTNDAAWLNGQIALYPCGEWEVAASNGAKLNWGVSVMPVGPTGVNTTSIGGIEWGIPVNSQHKTEALNFIKVLLSRDYALATGIVTNPKDYFDPQIQATWKKTPGMFDAWMANYQQLQHTKYNFLENPFWYPDGATAYNNALGQILTQSADPGATMKAAAQTINQGIATATAS